MHGVLHKKKNIYHCYAFTQLIFADSDVIHMILLIGAGLYKEGQSHEWHIFMPRNLVCSVQTICKTISIPLLEKQFYLTSKCVIVIDCMLICFWNLLPSSKWRRVDAKQFAFSAVLCVLQRNRRMTNDSVDCSNIIAPSRLDDCRLH